MPSTITPDILNHLIQALPAYDRATIAQALRIAGIHNRKEFDQAFTLATFEESLNG